MARRRARVQKSEEQEEQVQQQQQQPESDSSELSEAHDLEEPESRPAADGMRSLRFQEELSWRPAKPIPTGTLIPRLERLSAELSEFDQGEVDLESLKDVAEKLAHRHLLQHKDTGVKAYTACCLVDILRLYVPDAPFTNDQLKMMYALFVKDILPALYDPSNPYNMQHKYVLVSLTDVKSILLLHDIDDADKLVLHLFNSTFDGISGNAKSKSGEQIAKDVELHLATMLTLLIDEASGSVSANVIDAIISQFLRAAPPRGSKSKEQNGNQATLLHKTEPPAYAMASKICNGCADKMTRYVSQYFGDVILDASSFASKAVGNRQGADSDDEDVNAGPSESDIKSLRQAHTLIRELWRTAPTILQNVVPQIEAELSADNVHLRLLATETFGDMIAGIGAAGPPQPPILDPTAYPPLRMEEEDASTDSPRPSGNVLTRPYSPHSFAQTHHTAYRNFVGRKKDKSGAIRAAWVTAVGYILSTSAGGIGLSRIEEVELVKDLTEKLSDGEEKVRLAAVKAIELFDFRDIILKLGAGGGIDKEGSIFASLGDRSRDRKQAVRVEAMVLLGKLWAVGAGEIAAGHEAVMSCLGGIPKRIINNFYANDADLNVLLDRVMFEYLVPLKYPNAKATKDSKGKSASGQGKTVLTPAAQDALRAERILLMLKSLDVSAQKAFFAMQARQPQFAKALSLFIQQCEAYNGGEGGDGSREGVKASMNKTLDWLATSFPDALKVRSDLQKFAKLNDRRSYQLIKFAIESESDFQKVRRSINELVSKLQGASSSASATLDTLIPLMYRSGSLMFNRSHLTTIMDYSKSDKFGLASVAHSILNDISTRNPDLFKAHSEELRKSIVDQAPSASKSNDSSVVDILKAYSSYCKKYPNDIELDRAFVQILMSYALNGTPPKAAKYAINIILSKGDDREKVTATNLLQKVMKDLKYEAPNFLNRLASISQLSRLAPTVTADFDDTINDMTIKHILREVRTAASESDPSWVAEPAMDKELQAKSLALKILVNRAIASSGDADAGDRVKALFKLLKTFVVQEGEFCKTTDTPLHHKKYLRLLAGQCILKLCTIKQYDDQFDPASFNKLAELVQDSELHVRRRFMEKLHGHLARDSLRPRFYTILFLVAFEPIPEVKERIEASIRSRARYFENTKRHVLEAMMARLLPLLAHHPDYSSEPGDLLDFAKYILFYLGAVATEANIGLIYKYAERVKQAADALKPDDSDNLYVLSDLAQSAIRKYQERRNWSFQAYPGKVGLPHGIYAALPSSEAAQRIAKKQYIPDELDEKLDDLVRAMDRKKKRKSVHDVNDQPAKKAKNQIKTVIREKPASKFASTKKSTKPKRKVKEGTSSSTLPTSERRRSGRAHVSSSYKERDDEEDDEEMWEGATGWDYVDEGDSDESQSADEDARDDADDESPAVTDGEEEQEVAASKKTAKGKASTGAAKVQPGRGKSRASKAGSDMDVDYDDDDDD